MIGCINFMNLSTSKNMNNLKEIAIRKIMGGNKKIIISQFLIESIILSFIALNIALYTVELLLPAFNNFIGKQLNISYFNNWWVIPILILFGIMIGLLSGIYPSFYLSIVKPIDIFREEKRKNSINTFFRKILVVMQFSISIILIIASFIIAFQVNYMKKMELGFTKSNNIIVPIRGNISIAENYEQIKQEIAPNSNIIDVAISSNSIGNDIGNYSARLENNDKDQSMYYLFVDHDFINHFNIKIIAGRNFSNEIQTDISSWNNLKSGSFILNESAVKSFGWTSADEALGKEIVTGLGGRKLKIIGVIKDFHFMGLQNKIEPLIFEYFPNQFRTINISVNPSNKAEALKFIESKWKELFPENPFYYYFLDDDFNKHYNEETKAEKLIFMFTIFAIFIACLGLYGLTLYTVEQKTKEIGIKKVLGATVTKIVLNMSSGFMWLVLISNILAWPLVYIFMDKWLQNFSYRIDMPYWVFIAAGIIALIIAQCTISLHAVIAANRNPVKALKYE